MISNLLDLSCSILEKIILSNICIFQIFYEINAVEPLKKLASSPNDVASKLAAEALKTIGEKIPHTLSQQVPLWSVPDVVYWVSQVTHTKYKLLNLTSVTKCYN